MVKKTNTTNRKRTKAIKVKRRVVRITSNPFLNFFLSVCKLKGNKVVEKIAKNAAVDWRKMNYLDKTPYYLLADEATKRKKRSVKKKNVGQKKYSDSNGPMMVLSRQKMDLFPPEIKSETDVEGRQYKPSKIKQRRKSEGARRKKSFSSIDCDAVLSSDAEGIESLIYTSQKDLRRRKFWPGDVSESSFGLSTSISGSTLDVVPSDSSVGTEDIGKCLHRTHDFYH